MIQTIAIDLYHHWMPTSLRTCHVMHLLHRDHLGVLQPLRYRIATISLSLQTRLGPLLQETIDSGFRSTQLPFNVLSVRSGSQGLTIFDLIYEHTLMNGRSFAQSAARLSPVSMIGNGTKAYTVARRNSSAEVNWVRVESGVVVAASREQTPSVGTSGAKLAGSASNLCWMRRLRSDSDYSRSR